MGFGLAAESAKLRAEGAIELSVILPRGFHPFPSRTRKLSPAGPIVLHAKVCGRVGRRRHKIKCQSWKHDWLFPFLFEFVWRGRPPHTVRPANACSEFEL